MTTKIVLAVVAATAISGSIFSQQTSKQDSLPVVKTMQNEIGASFVPVLITLLGGQPGYSNIFSITYKKRINNHSLWRVRVLANLHYNPSRWDHNYLVVDQTDSTETRNVYDPFKKPSWVLKTGYEYNRGKRKFKWLAGSDLYCMFSSYHFHSSVEQYKIDTLHNSILYDRTLSYTSLDLRDYSVGLSPFVGVKYSLSKRFYIAAEFGFNFEFSLKRTYDTYDNSLGSSSTEERTVEFQVYSDPIMADLSLNFRF